MISFIRIRDMEEKDNSGEFQLKERYRELRERLRELRKTGTGSGQMLRPEDIDTVLPEHISSVREALEALEHAGRALYDLFGIIAVETKNRAERKEYSCDGQLTFRFCGSDVAGFTAA